MATHRIRPLRRRSLVAAMCAVALVTASCGIVGGGSKVPDGMFETRLTADPPLPKGADKLLRARLDEHHLSDVEYTIDGSRRTIKLRLPDTAAGREALDAIETIGVLEFRPVLELFPPDGADVTPPDERRPDAEVVLVELDEAGEPTIGYRLGASAVPEGSVKTARAEVGTGDNWTVVVVLSDAGTSAFNAMAAANLNGQVAIVVDGRVVSAPRVVEPEFGSEVSVSGNFTKPEAEALASAITAGPIHLRPAKG